MENQFTASEVSSLRSLLDIEAIRRLRLDFSLAIDLRNMDGVIALFTDDALCEYGPYGTWEGKETIARNYREMFEGETVDPPFTSQHINTNHTVDILSDTTAKGDCYLIDLDTSTPPAENPVICFAHYDEEYRKDNGRWRFSRSSLNFLWPQRQVLPDYS
ncbi:nuclear transport factor 2 family protein [Seongchinamella unica]|uniref:Nuclear transport factor 2 family protein n=1 Tax=Seongchinamella unica TaxID=2547392 RepID=A0A4R5LR62_9GAMM|nr:nuclear transport factor 2 family protein [Seongchinamella unica]TDG13321.1 nuclear transport factor 2 family protein [Seongchinamella unica]